MDEGVKAKRESSLAEMRRQAMEIANNRPIGTTATANTNDDETGLPVDGEEIPFRPAGTEEDEPKEESSEEKKVEAKPVEEEGNKTVDLDDDTLVSVKINGQVVQKPWGEIRSDFAGREMITRKSQSLSESQRALDERIQRVDELLSKLEGKGVGKEKPEEETPQRKFSIEDFGIDPKDPMANPEAYRNMISKLNELANQVGSVSKYVQDTEIKESQAEQEKKINTTRQLLNERAKDPGSPIQEGMEPLVYGLFEMAKVQAKAEPNGRWNLYGPEQGVRDLEAFLSKIPKKPITEKDISPELMQKLHNKWLKEMSGKEKDFSANKAEGVSDDEVRELDQKVSGRKPLSLETGLSDLRSQAINKYGRTDF